MEGRSVIRLLRRDPGRRAQFRDAAQCGEIAPGAGVPAFLGVHVGHPAAVVRRQPLQNSAPILDQRLQRGIGSPAIRPGKLAGLFGVREQMKTYIT